MIQRTKSLGLPLLLIALAVGWGCFSLALMTVAEARVGSVMMRLMAHVFLAFAVTAVSVALLLLIRRSVSRSGSARRIGTLRQFSGATLLTGAWLMEITSGALHISLIILAVMIAMSLSLDHRAPPGGGSAFT